MDLFWFSVPMEMSSQSAAAAVAKPADILLREALRRTGVTGDEDSADRS